MFRRGGAQRKTGQVGFAPRCGGPRTVRAWSLSMRFGHVQGLRREAEGHRPSWGTPMFAHSLLSPPRVEAPGWG